MPITEYQFENRVFFAIESGDITRDDAQEWSDKLKDATQNSDLPIVALVDAMTVNSIHRAAQQIFIESAYFENLLAVVVAANPVVSLQARTIGLLGKRGHTRIVMLLEKAWQVAEKIIAENTVAPD